MQSPTVLPPNYTVEPTQDGERQVTVRRVGDTQLLMSSYHVPSATHADGAAIEMMVPCSADPPSGRFINRLLKLKRHRRYSISLFRRREPGFLLLGAELKKDMPLDAARETLLDTIETLANNAPTKEETDRARASLLKQIDLSLNRP